MVPPHLTEISIPEFSVPEYNTGFGMTSFGVFRGEPEFSTVHHGSPRRMPAFYNVTEQRLAQWVNEIFIDANRNVHWRYVSLG